MIVNVLSALYVLISVSSQSYEVGCAVQQPIIRPILQIED